MVQIIRDSKSFTYVLAQMQMPKTYEDAANILGISLDAASPEEFAENLKKAYRSLSGQYHPDRHEGVSEEEMKVVHENMKAVNEAYSILVNYISESENAIDFDFKEYMDNILQDIQQAQPTEAEKSEKLVELEETLEFLNDGLYPVNFRDGGVAFVANLNDATWFYVDESILDNPKYSDIREGEPVIPKRLDFYRSRLDEKIKEVKKQIKNEKKKSEVKTRSKEMFEQEGLTSEVSIALSDVSVENAQNLMEQILRTQAIRPLTKGKRKGQLVVEPKTVWALAEQNTIDAKFIAAVVSDMRGYIDNRVTSNFVGMMDSGAWADDIANMVVYTGNPDGKRDEQEAIGFRNMPRSKADAQSMITMTREEYMELKAKEWDARGFKIGTREEAMQDAAEDYDTKRAFAEKGIWLYDEGNYSQVLKDAYPEFFEKSDRIDQIKKEVSNKIKQYSRDLSGVLIKNEASGINEWGRGWNWSL